jgi:hypothetical protein
MLANFLGCISIRGKQAADGSSGFGGCDIKVPHLTTATRHFAGWRISIYQNESLFAE